MVWQSGVPGGSGGIMGSPSGIQGCCCGCPRNQGDFLCPFDPDWTDAELEAYWVKGKSRAAQIVWLCNDPHILLDTTRNCFNFTGNCGGFGDPGHEVGYREQRENVAAFATYLSASAQQNPGTDKCDPWQIFETVQKTILVPQRNFEYGGDPNCCDAWEEYHDDPNFYSFDIRLTVTEDGASARVTDSFNGRDYNASVSVSHPDCPSADPDITESSFWNQANNTYLFKDCLKLQWLGAV